MGMAQSSRGPVVWHALPEHHQIVTLRAMTQMGFMATCGLEAITLEGRISEGGSLE